MLFLIGIWSIFLVVVFFLKVSEKGERVKSIVAYGILGIVFGISILNKTFGIILLFFLGISYLMYKVFK